MSLPAAIALRKSLARSLVVAASKKSVSSRFLSAALRSLVQRVSPCALANCASFASLRPRRIGSGITRSPFLSATPPCARMATIERIRCWFIPMRPVTPFMMMPSRCCAMLLLHSQQSIDTPRVLAEPLVGLHLEGARMRELDAEIVGHARRPRGEHDHARAEKHRLGDAVGDEDDGLLRFLPDAQQLDVHLLARERIERAEWLVHQDQLGIVDERAGDGRALLHAAGKLVGVFVLVALEPDQSEEIARTPAALGYRKSEDFRREEHVVDDAPPLQQQRLLEHHADIARGIERLRARADRHLAGIEWMQARENLQQRGLAAAGGAHERDELAHLDVEARLRDGQEIRSSRAVDLLHAGEMDERFAHGDFSSYDSRASRTTSTRSSASTNP